MSAAAAASAIATNDATVQEISLETAGLGAERGQRHPQQRDSQGGGNTLRGSFFGSFTNGSLQGDNYDQHLKDLKLTAIDKVKSIYDVNPAVGGPLKQDTLWFFGAYRYWGNERYVGGNFYNKTPESFLYTPDLSRPAFEGDRDGNQSLRLTWRASLKNKVSAQFQNNQQVRDHFYGQGRATVAGA